MKAKQEGGPAPPVAGPTVAGDPDLARTLADDYFWQAKEREREADYSGALALYRKALEIYLQVSDPVHRDTATSYNNIGVVYWQMGEYAQTLKPHIDNNFLFGRCVYRDVSNDLLEGAPNLICQPYAPSSGRAK